MSRIDDEMKKDSARARSTRRTHRDDEVKQDRVAERGTKKQGKRVFRREMKAKLVVFFLGVLLAFLGLSVRLLYIVKNNEIEYQKEVFSQQSYDSITIPFRRGDIVDAKGTKLATTEKVYNLIIDAKVMLDKEEYLEPTLGALAKCFPELDMAAIRKHISDNPTSSWYVAKKQLSYNEISEFKALQEEENKIKGVWFEDEYKRYYPGGSLACDVIGFTRSDNEGMYGLEEYYNDVLNGTNGREYGYLNDDLALERTVKPAEDGYTIHSTIDANVQDILERALEKFNDTYANGARTGNGAENVGAIVMRVKSGEILGMANYPKYNLNDTRNIQALIGSNLYEEITNDAGYKEVKKTTTIIDEEVLSTLNDAQLYVNLNNLWKNYCISSTYEPGSTMKPFTTAAALEIGAVEPDSCYECNGVLEVGGHQIHCHNRSGDGVINLQTAIAQSCNVAMMRIGQIMGKDAFCTYQQNFNFGLKTNIDLAGEFRTANLMKEVSQVDAADLATYTFGQNFNVTMIQMISGFCSLINGGYYYEPHMVNKITNSAGATVKTIEPRVLRQTISPSTSQWIRQFCTAVVTEGTGKSARPAGYLIGGKSGTAQTLPRGNNEYIVSFLGFAPVDDPELAVYVVVDRPNSDKQDQSKYATGILRDIMTELLPYENIYMTEELSEAEIQELEERKLENTLKYGRPVEETGEEDGEGENAEGQEDESSVQITLPKWMKYEKDPATGCYIDPNTGELLDPDTGDPIDGFYMPLSE